MNKVIIFTRVEDVPKAFISHFLEMSEYKSQQLQPVEQPYIRVTTYKESDLYVLIRYYKKGDRFSSEESLIEYPSITIQNFAPVINDKIKYPVEYLEEGFYTNTSGVKVGTKVFLPIPFLYRFQLTGVTKLHFEQEAIQNWFYKNFSIGFMGAGFLFRSEETDYGKIGIPITYKASMEQSDRPDRKFQVDVTFNLTAFVHVKVEVTEESLESIELALGQMTPDFTRYEVFNSLL